MQYLGGKYRIRKPLSVYLKTRLAGRLFVEPFCGAANITAEMEGPRIATDANPFLITLHRAVQAGWVPPEFLSEKDWEDLKNRQDPANPLTAFAGFGVSFGGMWFGSYAADRVGPGSDGRIRHDLYARAASRGLLKKHSSCKGVVFECCSYEKLTFGEGSLVYCDPPYRGTAGYAAVGAFDHDRFYAWCRNTAQRGATVLVSEYIAPSDWACVWAQDVKVTLSAHTNNTTKTEKLFEVPRD